MVRVGTEDVLFPTGIIGSYPRAPFLHGKVLGEFDEPDFMDYQQRTLYEMAVAQAVLEQERAGVDIISDGQQYQEFDTDYEYHQHFQFVPHRSAGFKRYGEPIAVELYNMFHAPTVVGDIKWVRPMLRPVLETVKKWTSKPVKLGLIGPLTQSVAVTDHYYQDPKKMAMAMAEVYNDELRDLSRRGLDQFTLHEPWPYFEPEPWHLEVWRRTLEGVDAYTVWHICYGNQGGNPGVLVDRGKDMFPLGYETGFDQIEIEMKRRQFSDLPSLKGFPKDRDLGVGLIDVKSSVTETPEEVADDIMRVVDSGVVAPERLSITMDCGLGNMKRVPARKKVEAMAQGAALARARVEGRG